MLEGKSSLALAHEGVEKYVRPGDRCVDATAGRGRDTAWLCRLVGEKGKVWAFDIQERALEETGKLLAQEGLLERAELILDSHEHMGRYVGEGGIAAAVFNFGYLPGSDRTVHTRAKTSLRAIGEAMGLIRPGGVVSLCLYYGGVSGFEEKDAILSFLQGVDAKAFTVLQHSFLNRPNCPPIVAEIEKHGPKAT